MDEKLLAALDLNPSEIAVYTAVLESGGLPPAQLAKVAGMKRTTAYSVAGSLVEKGLLIEDATKRPRVFTPSAPEQVLALMDTEKKRVSEREGVLTNLANELSKRSAAQSYPVPTVRFIPEDKLDGFLRQQAPLWDTNMLETEPTWWGFQDHTFVERYGTWIASYWEQAPKEIDLKLLSNRAPAEVAFANSYENLERRNIKYWGEATGFLSTTWVIGDYIVMINTRTKPFYLVEIHDKLMAHDQREVFRNLWDMV
ncbi:MAG: Transcriptional regulator, TrmB [Parcubacteria bacterium C7867-004]|nr:MAG: Transcriptional regulator, TrmB [Parcubacteria bacterium C7867-004]